MIPNGLEPLSSSRKNDVLTIRRRIKKKKNDLEWIRTINLLFNRQSLYQLSYEPKIINPTTDSSTVTVLRLRSNR